MSKPITTYRFRLKNPKDLPEKARAVNYVWNYCGDVQNQTKRWSRRWLSSFDLCKLLSGSSKDLGLTAATIQNVARQFTKSRDQIRHRPRWRKTGGSGRSLGWIPLRNEESFQLKGSSVVYLSKSYPMYMHRKIEGRILCGSFSEDNRGRWYVNITCELSETPKKTAGDELGVDLGLKDFATFSTGEKLTNPRHYRREEEQLGKAQRAGRKDRVRAIHTKIKNRRKHDLHVASAALIKRAKTIYVGDVSASKLAKTSMAKSVLDAGWSMFREQLRYKALKHGVTFAEVDERYTTQTCFCCKSRTGPKGQQDLKVREWTCVRCGALHDRDTNAARNIFYSGQVAALLTEISS